MYRLHGILVGPQPTFQILRAELLRDRAAALHLIGQLIFLRLPGILRRCALEISGMRSRLPVRLCHFKSAG